MRNISILMSKKKTILEIYVINCYVLLALIIENIVSICYNYRGAAGWVVIVTVLG